MEDGGVDDRPVGDRDARLADLVETYARQVAAFDDLVARVRAVPLGDAPLSLEAEGTDPGD
ncbi:MAG: hypothetical protein KDB63_04740 [Nocardioidaceae bacterium]|nr:hypothetical protein [Nocardioidaceae bacterium]